MTIGLLILGIGIGILLIPTIPELIKIGNTKVYKQNEIEEKDRDKVSDMSSGLFNFSLNFSGFISPNLGGYVVKQYGFNRACSLLGLIVLIVCIIYGIVCKGFIAFKTFKRPIE